MTFNENLRHMPLLRLLAPFLSGDILGLTVYFDPPVILFFLVLTLITFYLFAERKIFSSAVSYRYRWTGGVLVVLWLLVFGFFTGHQAIESITLKPGVEVEKSCICSAAVKETVSASEKGSTMILRILKCDTDSSFEGRQVLSFFEKDSAIQLPGVGDRVLFKGFIKEISKPTNPGQFNYKQYMFYHKVLLQTYISTGNFRITDKAAFFFLRRNAASIKDKIAAIYRKYGLDGQQFAVLAALTLGDKNELEKETVSSFAKSGAMHVLAVSGLHTGIIYLVFAFLLKFMDRSRFMRLLKLLLLILVLWAYAFLTGLSPSVTRAAFMFSFLAAGKALNRSGNIYNTIAASAFVLIFINPFIITYAGFQFSYAAVLSIVFFHPYLYSLMDVENRFADAVWSLICVSVAAQIGTFPLGLFYFHQFANYFLLTNLIVIPLVTLIIYLALILIVFSFIPCVSTGVAFILSLFISGMNSSVSFIGNLPFAALQHVDFGNVMLLLTYISILLTTLLVILRKYYLFYLLLFCLMLTEGFVLKHRYDKRHSKQMVIYDVNRTTAINFISGNENLLCLSSRYDSISVEYAARNHWISTCLGNPIWTGFSNAKEIKNLESVEVVPSSKIPGLTIIWFLGKKIVVCDTTLEGVANKDSPFNTDYLIVTGNAPHESESLSRFFSFDHLIIDSSCNYYSMQEWKKISEECKLNSWIIGRDGAFVAVF